MKTFKLNGNTLIQQPEMKEPDEQDQEIAEHAGAMTAFISRKIKWIEHLESLKSYDISGSVPAHWKVEGYRIQRDEFKIEKRYVEPPADMHCNRGTDVEFAIPIVQPKEKIKNYELLKAVLTPDDGWKPNTRLEIIKGWEERLSDDWFGGKFEDTDTIECLEKWIEENIITPLMKEDKSGNGFISDLKKEYAKIEEILLSKAKELNIYVDFSDKSYDGDKEAPMDLIGFLVYLTDNFKKEVKEGNDNRDEQLSKEDFNDIANGRDESQGEMWRQVRHISQANAWLDYVTIVSERFKIERKH